MPIKILFCGAGRQAVTIFHTLLQYSQQADDLSLCGIITQPDKQAGRGQQLTACPCKAFFYTCRTDIPCFQPESLREMADKILATTQPDLIVVIDYGQIISPAVLAYPKFKCLNIHHSLLPVLRGATPIPMAILQGLKQALQVVPDALLVGCQQRAETSAPSGRLVAPADLLT